MAGYAPDTKQGRKIKFCARKIVRKTDTLHTQVEKKMLFFKISNAMAL